MADSKVPAKVSNLKVPPIPEIETPLRNERVWEYQRRVQETVANRGSRYPAFSIEPLPWERQRIASPMTPEDRFLRKQWLLDQNLSPNEPKYVPEAQPMFTARRLIRLPWDVAEYGMAKVIGPSPARVIRTAVPKLFMAFGITIAGLYHIYYNPKNWETQHGILICGSKHPKFQGEDNSKISADPEVFHTLGFENRKSHFNARTSAAGQ